MEICDVTVYHLSDFLSILLNISNLSSGDSCILIRPLGASDGGDLFQPSGESRIRVHSSDFDDQLDTCSPESPPRFSVCISNMLSTTTYLLFLDLAAKAIATPILGLSLAPKHLTIAQSFATGSTAVLGQFEGSSAYSAWFEETARSPELDE